MANDRVGLTGLGKLFIFLFVLACIAGAFLLWRGGFFFVGEGDPDADPSVVEKRNERRGRAFGGDEHVKIGIAYGTEKKKWLEWATDEFAVTDDGRRIEIELIPMGSVEGAQAVLEGDERIHVWSPASDLYKDVFVQGWRDRHGSDPIVRGADLALSPMVFVFWDERYEAFTNHLGEVDFDTLYGALQDLSGWSGIADKPEWGLFKLGHTHPNESNSGLMTLVLMAYSYHGTDRDLTLQDILDPDFQTWLGSFEAGVSGLLHSTGTMMRDMVLKGPSTYDALVVYENLAIDYLESAQGRWGSLRVAYPSRNMWNSNPYYIIDAPWSSDEQREAAGVYLDFLLSRPIQEQALVHGFRPADVDIDIINTFSAYERYGIRVDLASISEPPRAEVLTNLLQSWQRAQGRR